MACTSDSSGFRLAGLGGNGSIYTFNNVPVTEAPSSQPTRQPSSLPTAVSDDGGGTLTNAQMGAAIAIPVFVMLLGILYMVKSYNAVNTVSVGVNAVAVNSQSYAAVSTSGASNTGAVVPNATSVSDLEMTATK